MLLSMKHYRLLLQSEPLLRRLSLVQLIAYFGAWFSNVAIYTLLIQMQVSPAVVSAVAALHFLPGVLQAPFSGAIIDRITPRKLMLLLMAVEMLMTLGLTLIDDSRMLWLLFILVFIRMGASSFYFTLEMSLLPHILQARHLKAANEIHSVIWSFSYTFGMAVSGIVVYFVGVKTAFLLDAMLFALAFGLLAKASFPAIPRSETHPFFTLMKQSVAYLKAHPHIRHLILLHAVVGFTAFDALVALAAERYYLPAVAASLAIGLTHAMRALGLVAGPLLLGKWINNKRLFNLLLLQAAAIFLWAAVLPSFYASLAASVLVGLGTTTLWSYTYTLLQHHTDSAYYGRIVAYNDMAFLLSVALVSLLVGILADAGIDLQAVTALLGSGFIAGAWYYRRIFRRYPLDDIRHGL